MKTTRLTAIASFAIIAIAFFGCEKAGIGGPDYIIDGPANGMQAVPLSSSTATGAITGNYDGSNNTLYGTIKWSSLTGTPTAIHIHFGAPGKTGYPYFNLVKVPKGLTDSVTFSSSFTESLEGGVSRNLYYFDIHTSTFPNGEIRGQIIAH